MNEDSSTAQSRAIQDHDWQQRAVAAEAKANELEANLGAVNGALSESQAALSDARRKHEIDVELMRAGVVDLEAVRALAETAIKQSKNTDILKAVAELKKGKPFLFRTRKAAVSGMSASGRQVSLGLDEVAGHARATGDRRTLLKYLRAKRNA